MPWPVLVLAILAIVFFALPLVGLIWRAPWGDVWQYLTDETTRTALRLSIVCSLWATGLSILFGVPLAWLLARVQFPGRAAVRRAVHAVDGAAPGGRRRRTVLRARAARHRRPVPRSLVRHPAAVHDRRGRRGPDVRRHAVPRDHRRGRAAAARHPVRGRIANARRVELVHVPPGHRPGDPPSARRRCRAVVGARARRVRGDGHLRRQLPGTHADDAARRLPRARDQPAGGDRARPRADRDLVRGAGRASRPLARWAARLSSRCRSRRDAVGRDRRASRGARPAAWRSTSRRGSCWPCWDPTDRARRPCFDASPGWFRSRPAESRSTSSSSTSRRAARSSNRSDARSASCSRTTCCSPT